MMGIRHVASDAEKCCVEIADWLALALKEGRTDKSGCSDGYRVKLVPALRVGHGGLAGTML
jgi:hypothetical protein